MPSLTVSSRLTSSFHWAKGLGVYSLQGPDDDWNPVWQLGDKEWFIYYREKRWWVGNKGDGGYVRSEKTGAVKVTDTSWQYHETWWRSGTSITVKGK